MHFTRIEGFDVVVRITGPTHHFLGIEFGPGTAREARVEDVALERSRREGPPPDPARSDAVRREVAAGVAAANERLGSRLGVRAIRYCTDDPATPGAYAKLAEALAERIAGEEAPTLRPVGTPSGPRKAKGGDPSRGLATSSAPRIASPSKQPGPPAPRYPWRRLIDSLSPIELKRLERELVRSKRRRKPPAH